MERLKRELEEVKNAPRGLEGTFRTAAEMERHRAQVWRPARLCCLWSWTVKETCFASCVTMVKGYPLHCTTSSNRFRRWRLDTQHESSGQFAVHGSSA